MKLKILYVSILLFNFYSLFAQDSIFTKNNLVITISKGENKLSMTIRVDTSSFKNLSPLDLQNINHLVLNNKTNTNDFKLFIAHTGGANPIPVIFTGNEIKKLDTTIYQIRNDSIIGKSFSLNSNFSIQLKDKNENVIQGPIILKPKPSEVNINPESSSIKVISIPVYDAFFLTNNVNGSKQKLDTIRAILSSYENQKSLLSIDSLKVLYKQNNFILPYLDSLSKLATRSKIDAQSDKSKPVGFLSSAFSSIGGLDVTALADGAAKFIVKRAKQELSITFFEKFRDILNGTPDIGTVFPQTANLLYDMGDEIYEYEKYLQNLREAFKKDMQEIHRNLPGIIDNHPQFFTAHPKEKAALLTACYTAQELEDQAHPGDILANYPTEYLDSVKNNNYKGSIQTVQILSASVRDTSTAENASYWVNIKKIRDLVNNRQAFKIYLGLLLQEAKTKYANVPFEGTTLVQLLNQVAKKYDSGYTTYNSYRGYILRFGEKTEALNKMIKENDKSDMSDSSVIEKYVKYFRTSVDIIQYGTELSKLPIINVIPALQDLPARLKRYFEVGYSCADLVADINRKNYSAAINHTLHIYNVVTLKEEAGTDAEFNTARYRFMKYGSFMATVATAKNSDEVETAIETAALPVGSSRIKRVSDFNVSLNAYAGLFYGIERIKGVDSGQMKFNTFGVTAPIGVAVSWGHRIIFSTPKHEWSTSLYLSLIDLGALASFRFTDDSTAQVPTIKLKDIFSPGIFLSLGIPKTPLSFNLGAQAGPNLRKVTSLKNDFSDNLYWRYSLSLCVDIPVVNFHTKSK